MANALEVRSIVGSGSDGRPVVETRSNGPLPPYQRIFNPQGADSLAKVARRIAPGSMVLDVGSGSGVLSKYLAQEKGCTVDAVDIDPAAVETAGHWCRNARCADLDQVRLSDFLGHRQYSAIVCADVLEHLRRPDIALRDLHKLLAPGGRLMVSIPNVAYAGVVAELLSGRFEYRSDGILDATHLHFFTRESALDLLQRSGFGVLEVDPVTVDLTRSEFNPCIETLPAAVVDCLLSSPDALSYQFIVECVPVGSGTDIVQRDHTVQRSARQPLRFYVQAYWRSASGFFSEERHCWTTGEIGRERQVLKLELPADVRSPAEIRLDPADRPGYVRIRDISLYDHRGERLWRWDGKIATLASGRRQDLELAASGEEAVLLAAGSDPWLVLPIPVESLSRLTDGGRLEVDLSWPYSSDFTVLAHRLQEHTHELGELDALRQELNALRQDLNVSQVRQEATGAQLQELKTQLHDAVQLRLAAEGHAAWHQQKSNELADRLLDLAVVQQQVGGLHAGEVAAQAENEALKAQLENARQQIDGLKSRLTEAARLRAVAGAQGTRHQGKAEELEVALPRLDGALALADAEMARAAGSLREAWKATGASILASAHTILNWRPWQLGNRLGETIRRLRGAPPVDLAHQLHAACFALDEALRLPADDASWLERQTAALVNLGACCSHVCESRRYRTGQLIGRFLSIPGPWRGYVDPTPALASALQIGLAIVRGMSSVQPMNSRPRTALHAGEGPVPQVVETLCQPPPQRFFDIIDVVVEMTAGSTAERANLDRIVEVTSPPYRLWISAPTPLRDSPWLVEFAHTQGATLINQGTSELLEDLRHSLSSAVAFVSTDVPLADGWLDDALFALNGSVNAGTVSLCAAADVGSAAAVPDRGVSRALLARKQVLASLPIFQTQGMQERWPG